jgi:two-component system, response regulator YesN
MKNRLFQRYLLFFAVVIITPLIMGSIFYYQTIQSAKRGIQDNNELKIGQIEKTFSLIVSEIERVGSHAIMEAQFEDLLTKELNNFDFSYYKWNFLNKNELSPYSLSNKIIGEYYIFLRNSQMVYGPNFCSSLETFWNYIFNVPEMNRQTWIDTYLGQKWAGEFLTDLNFINVSQESGSNYIPYIKSFHFQGNISGAIVFFLPKTELLTIFNEISYTKNGSVGIIKNNGEILLETSPGILRTLQLNPRELSNHQMIKNGSAYLTVHKLFNFPGTLVISQPQKNINSQALYISRITIYLIIIMTLIGTVIGIIASFFTSKPLINILRDIKEQQLETDADENRVFDLRSFFRDISGQNKKLKLELNEQLPYFKQLFFKSVLSGEMTDEEILKKSKQFDFDLSTEYYTVACADIFFNNNTDGIIIHIGFREVMKSILSKKINYYQISQNRYVFISELTGKTQEAANKEALLLFRHLKEKLEQELQEPLQFGIGQPRKSMSHLYKSLTEARIVLKSVTTSPGEIAVFDSNARGSKIQYNYSAEIENRLINFVKLGKLNKLNDFLLHLKSKNMNPEIQSTEVQGLFLNNLLSTLLKTYSESELTDINLEQQIKSLSTQSTRNNNERFSLIQDLFQDFSKIIFSSENKTDDKLKRKITEFLHKEFTNKTLNLAAAAAEFEFSSFYFSRIFTQLFDESFRNYLENIRLEYIKDNLINTEKPLKEISYDAGYSSLNTFSKVFKRKYGYSASEFRKISR